MGCAKYTIAMTGTLLNGYASNLFELIFRMFPHRMKEMGFEWGDVGKWIDLYGVREKVTKTLKDPELNNSSNGSSKRVNMKEMPAAAPQLFTDMLSDVACFIQMSDLFEVLPKLQEGPIYVPQEGERRLISCVTKRERAIGRFKRKIKKSIRLAAPSWYLQKNLRSVENILRNAVEKELQGGGTSVLLGSLLNTLLSYPDVPFNFSGVFHPDTGQCIVPESYRLSDRLLYPKELQLIRFVKAQLRVGRRVGIYATYTGKMGTLQRLQMLLEERRIKTAILESNVDGPEREEWIAEREKEGVQVLLTNPILVSTGLDLLGFPSLYFYQTGYRLSIVRQASRRHWRIGQQSKCLTLYNAYKGTMQELAIDLMAKKMSAALALEGQFSQDGLAALTEGSGGSLATELAKRFCGQKIEGVESAESIWGKMTIDAAECMTNTPNSANMIDCLEQLGGTNESESLTQSFLGDSLENVIMMWVREIIPEDMHARFGQQITYAIQNVQNGIEGLAFNTELGRYKLQWNPLAVPTSQIEFRRWVYRLMTKPMDDQSEANGEIKLELIFEGKKPKVKSKKVYNVSEGQIAFNF